MPTNQPSNEAVDQIIDMILTLKFGVRAKAHQAITTLLVEARISERKEVALDNYYGHTFSDATDYKGKFNKFFTNNEKRIVQLQALNQSPREEK